MEHPVQYLSGVTKFLDRMIEEYGDQLFVVFGFICFGIMVWIIARRRKQPVREIPIVVLPMGNAPRREQETDPPPFDDRPGL